MYLSWDSIAEAAGLDSDEVQCLVWDDDVARYASPFTPDEAFAMIRAAIAKACHIEEWQVEEVCDGVGLVVCSAGPVGAGVVAEAAAGVLRGVEALADETRPAWREWRRYDLALGASPRMWRRWESALMEEEPQLQDGDVVVQADGLYIRSHVDVSPDTIGRAAALVYRQAAELTGHLANMKPGKKE